MSEGVDFPWLRRIEVVFEGGGYDAGSPFVSTGKPDAYRITAHVHKEIMGMPPATELTMYNLSSATRSILENNKIMVTLSAGWEQGPNAGMKEVFSGELLAASSRRQGTDIVTSLSCLSGINSLPAAREIVTFNPGQRVSIAAAILAARIKGVTVESVNIKGIEGVIGSKGWSASGLVKTELTRLAKEHSFSWTVVDNVFYAVGDAEGIGDSIALKEPYLISVNPILNGPMRIVSGIGWHCTFEADINPGRFVKIDSEFAGRHNGEYRVNTITHYLDCFDDAGFTSAGHAYVLGKR